MPFIHIKALSASLTADTIDRLQRGTTELTSSILRKDPALTSVLVESTMAGTWMIGGASRSNAVHVSIYITVGTNTAAEKAHMIAAEMALLKDALGDLHPATYVIIHEIAADAWGHDGLTQASRHDQAKQNIWDARFQRSRIRVLLSKCLGQSREAWGLVCSVITARLVPLSYPEANVPVRLRCRANRTAAYMRIGRLENIASSRGRR